MNRWRVAHVAPQGTSVLAVVNVLQGQPDANVRVVDPRGAGYRVISGALGLGPHAQAELLLLEPTGSGSSLAVGDLLCDAPTQ